jgi:hypothetical protein
MLKTTAFALAVLVIATLGAGSAFADGGVRTPPRLLGKIDKGATMKKFLARKLGQKTLKLRTVRPHHLPGQ